MRSSGRTRRRVAVAEVPIEAGHDGERLARERDGQMFVRRMLRAARIGMRHPDRRQAKPFGEDVVRQRAAEVRQDRGLASRRSLAMRRRRKARPRMLGIEPRRRGRSRRGPSRSAPSESRGDRDGGAAPAGMSSGSVPTTKRSWPRAQARGGTALTGLSGLPARHRRGSRTCTRRRPFRRASGRARPSRIDLRDRPGRTRTSQSASAWRTEFGMFVRAPIAGF